MKKKTYKLTLGVFQTFKIFAWPVLGSIIDILNVWRLFIYLFYFILIKLYRSRQILPENVIQAIDLTCKRSCVLPCTSPPPPPAGCGGPQTPGSPTQAPTVGCNQDLLMF